MWPHFISLLHQVLRNFLVQQGTTSWGFVSNWIPAIFSALVAALVILLLRGRQAVIDHWKQNLGIVLGAAILGNLLWYIPIFGWTAVKTVYQDHQTLTAEAIARQKKLYELQHPSAIRRSFFVSNSIWGSSPGAEYVLTTNSDQSPVEISVSCEMPLKDAEIRPISEDGFSISHIGQHRLSASGFDLVMKSPTWTPEAPLLVDVIFQHSFNNPLSQCEIAFK